MLKRLELIGFKSFADKTAFDFGHGITAIVGPNGSGKSNVVDAVRWILGEQSAKSLRGGEMTDVIFNGSASRRSFGMAEVTLTFDNARRQLSTDVEEVQVTRRVYRSGEGEYLINQTPCRLKDIKDLFLGSGAGTDAYCIIAQGKVDVMLQSSTKERRTIFEEAAGISRFKAKKIETLRKLERVDLNVQRLKDIIDEVEKQLRSVKLQAAKAQRFQEYSSRLKELRVGLGLQDFHHIADKLQIEETELDRLRGELDQQGSQVLTWEEGHRRLEESLVRLEEELHTQEAKLAHARQQINTQQTTLAHETTLSTDLEKELAKVRDQINELTATLTSLHRSLQAAHSDLTAAQQEAAAQQQRTAALEEGLQAIVNRLEQVQQQLETDKAQHLDQMRQAARLQNDAVSYKAQLDNLQRELTRLRQKSAQAAETLASIDVELEELTEADTSLQQKLQQSRRLLDEEKQERERLRQFRDDTGELISQLRQKRSGLTSRMEVLEGLERSHEGLGAGVGELLDMLQLSTPAGDDTSLWRKSVIGMVADFLTVRREYAPLIDLALGEWSQRFLVRDTASLAAALTERGEPFSSRVSFLPLKHFQTPGQSNKETEKTNRLIEVSLLGHLRIPLSGENLWSLSGVIARAEQLVSTNHPELQDLPKQLLGRTLIVRDLETAFSLAVNTTGYRLITLQGELLEPDGTLTVGTHHAEMGILSRKSELREIREQIATVDLRIAEAEHDLASLRERVAISDSRIQDHQQEIQVLTEQAADLRSRVEMHRDRRQGLHEEVTLSREEMLRLDQDIATLRDSWQQATEQAAAAETHVRDLHDRIAQAEAEIRQREAQRQQRHQEFTTHKIAQAKTEERVTSLQARFRQLQEDFGKRQMEHAQARDDLQSCRHRYQYSQQTMLHASAALAYGYHHKEKAEQIIRTLVRQRDRERQERACLAEQLQSVRGQWQSQQEQTHGHELAAHELRHKRDTLITRLREDYQIEIADLYQQALASGLWSTPAPDADDLVEVEPLESTDDFTPAVLALPWQLPTDADAANQEIADLRQKLSRLGSVNLDSLQELHDLEIRSTTLGAQYEDLTSAKRALEDIIGRINTDSRRLFQETYDMVRGHFQELFRKLFGGGMADIVLEDETDILESGIEIIARPPGKELRSISLLSGGEKTMTAVALLLSIFKSKPSPFCILDEVDAALDEANIGRFADVLRDFLNQSQFIIITHSKRTMSAADVIYGITMQESGISKRVSVRFEDWPDEGNAAVNGETQAVA
jgi:chromosome segregation protein